MGRPVVGGNLTGSRIQTGFLTLPPGPTQNVVVFGNTTIGKVSGRGEIVMGGNANSHLEESGGELVAFIGGSHSGTADQVTVSTNQSGSAFEAKSPKTDFPGLVSCSTYLSTLTGAIWNTPEHNNRALFSAPNAVQSQSMNWTSAKVTVLFARKAQLATGGLSVSGLDSGETIIVNVSGTSGSWNHNGQGNARSGTKNILWNFCETNSISVNSAIIGSVLPPNAEMSDFSGSTEGSVIPKSITLNNGEPHSQPLAGDLPEMPLVNPPPPAAGPLPAGLPLLLAALGRLAQVRRACA